MKKIIGLTIAALIIIGIAGVGTFAYFSDTETSTDNIFTAGTLDLKTNGVDGVSGTLYATSMSPGATVGPSTITLNNTGTTDGVAMDIVFSYAESDGSPNTVNESADEAATVLQVTTLTYDVTNLLATLTDTNGNGYIDTQDLTSATNVTNLTGLSGLNAGATKNFEIFVQLRSGTVNDFQADGIDVTVTFTLRAISGYFSDGEISIDDVLRVKVAPLFGTADNFVVLAYSTVTNTGSTTVTGDLGVSPLAAVVGFPPGIVNGTIHAADATAAQAKIDLTTAYNDAAGRTLDYTVTGDTLGGLNLTPGVYHGGALDLTGNLTLTGDANAVWIFQAESTLDTAADSQIILSGGARAANIYWKVGSSATLGANSIFKGNIMAYASITLYDGASLEGRALAQTAAVTLNANTITKPAP